MWRCCWSYGCANLPSRWQHQWLESSLVSHQQTSWQCWWEHWSVLEGRVTVTFCGTALTPSTGISQHRDLLSPLVEVWDHRGCGALSAVPRAKVSSAWSRSPFFNEAFTQIKSWGPWALNCDLNRWNNFLQPSSYSYVKSCFGSSFSSL